MMMTTTSTWWRQQQHQQKNNNGKKVRRQSRQRRQWTMMMTTTKKHTLSTGPTWNITILTAFVINWSWSKLNRRAEQGQGVGMFFYEKRTAIQQQWAISNSGRQQCQHKRGQEWQDKTRLYIILRSNTRIVMTSFVAIVCLLVAVNKIESSYLPRWRRLISNFWIFTVV